MNSQVYRIAMCILAFFPYVVMFNFDCSFYYTSAVLQCIVSEYENFLSYMAASVVLCTSFVLFLPILLLNVTCSPSIQTHHSISGMCTQCFVYYTIVFLFHCELNRYVKSQERDTYAAGLHVLRILYCILCFAGSFHRQ